MCVGIRAAPVLTSNRDWHRSVENRFWRWFGPPSANIVNGVHETIKKYYSICTFLALAACASDLGAVLRFLLSTVRTESRSRFCSACSLGGILEEFGWFGGMLEEFVREKHCFGWKKKRIKPGLRYANGAEIPRFDIYSVLGSVIKHPAQLMVRSEDTLELLLGVMHWAWQKTDQEWLTSVSVVIIHS